MKYAILLIETGDYLYSGHQGDPNSALRSREECMDATNFFHDEFAHVFFSSKEHALHKILNPTESDWAWVKINGQKIHYLHNLEIFEIVEVSDETI